MIEILIKNSLANNLVAHNFRLLLDGTWSLLQLSWATQAMTRTVVGEYN